MDSQLEKALTELEEWQEKRKREFILLSKPKMDAKGRFVGFDEILWLNFLTSAMKMKMAMQKAWGVDR